jgi:hypothetical protein
MALAFLPQGRDVGVIAALRTSNDTPVGRQADRRVQVVIATLQ